jgi:trimeric autotransporter adhesin
LKINFTDFITEFFKTNNYDFFGIMIKTKIYQTEINLSRFYRHRKFHLSGTENHLAKYCLVLFLLSSFKVFSQYAASYSFASLTRAYIGYSIGVYPSYIPNWVATTGISNNFISTADDTIHKYPVGFTFNFCGVNYDSVNVSCNGFMSFSNPIAAPHVNTHDSITGPGMLMPYWDRLHGYFSTSGFYYTIYADSGSAPNRMFLFEWGSSWFPYGFGSGPTAGRFQVRLYETTNIIEFCYTTSLTYGTNFSGTSATIGIANSTIDWQTVNNTGSSPTPSSTVFTDTLSVGPPVNQVYRWTPTPCSGTPAAGTVGATTLSGCATFSVGLSLSGASGGYGITYQWQSSPDSSSWSNISGATNTTGTVTVSANTYYRCITYCAGSGLNAASAGLKIISIPPPSGITGIFTVCQGLSVSLSDSTSGGLWTASNSNAVVGSASGIVTSITAGTDTIRYTAATGCSSTARVTVNPLPAAISGAASVCPGAAVTLTDPSTGGTWTSGNPAIATAGSSSGIVTGAATGIDTITYMLPTGCLIKKPITVNPLPSAISGLSAVCMGASITLGSTTSGGIWSASNTYAIAGSASGVVTGVGAGVDTIIYTLPTGCAVSKIVTVTVTPTAILGTASVCVGATTALSNPTGGGTWTSSDVLIATIGSGSGIATGVAAGLAIITYALPTGCAAYRVITVNTAPVPITGTLNVCVGGSVVLSDGTGSGVWSSSAPGIAGIGSSSGIVTGVSAGVTTISYTLANGCFATAAVTVTPLPANIIGAADLCVGATTTLSDGTTGGTWSSAYTGIASIGSASAVALGVAAGTTVISYILPSGCAATTTLTVDAMPYAITGYPAMCVSLTTTLSNAIPGGTWTSSDYSIAYIDPTSGIATGFTFGTATITYTLSTGCFTTISVTVNPAPTPITGLSNVCAGATTPLFDGVTGGIWSSGSPGIASVGSSSGIISGISGGSAIITYSMGAGCNVFMTVSVTPTPAPITGTMHVCLGSTSALSDGAGSGTWSSGSTGIATIGSSTGLVNALSPGASVITFTTGAGCFITAIFTVNPLPSGIAGVTHVCPGTSTTLSDGTGGGAWLSGSTAIATIGSSSGLLAGVTTGTTTVTYTLPTGCSATTPVTVNPLPSPISGPGSVCIGSTIAMSDPAIGGAWSKSNSNINIGLVSGIVTGVAAGAVTITYTLPTGCYVTKTITVNTSPGPIGGTLSVCQGQTTTLSDPTLGGVWTSTTTTIATIGSSSGIVTGIASGTSLISYSTGSGCLATATVTVNPLPAVFSVTGGGSYCAGGTGLHINLSGSVPIVIGSTTYQLFNLSTTVGTPLTGTGAPLDFGLQTSAGTYTVIATNTITGCTRTMTGSTVIVVNPLPLPITGATAVCVGATITESDGAPGGTWISTPTSVATIGSFSGNLIGVSIGTTIITYTLPTTCYTTTTVTVSISPTAITGASTVCAGATTPLADAISGGLWISSNTSIAVIGSSTGMVTGVAAGTVTITYSLGTGCTVTKPMTVNAAPTSITGSLGLCVAHTTALATTSTGGAWSSSNTSIATIGTTGIVNGITAGTATITYTLPPGCFTTATVTVNGLPGTITGTTHVCVGNSVALSDPATGGGTWTSSNTSIATIGSSTGTLAGVATGTVTVTYSLGTGCTVTTPATVNPLPIAIGTGPSSLCMGSTATLTDATTGGTWSSISPAIATIGSSSGIVSGITAGTTIIVYTLPTGCTATRTETVNPGPPTPTGITIVCVGATTPLTDPATGGVWTSTPTSIGTIGSVTGVVTGITAGIVTVTYSIPESGCAVTIPVTVNAAPAPISGASVLCVATSTILTDAVTGGTWISGSPSIATIGSATGIVSGVTTGTTVITYTTVTGCSITKTVTVTAAPSPITGPATILCAGTSVTLIDSTPGGTWSSSNSLVANIGSTTGLTLGVNTGTATITYSIGSGCQTIRTITVNPAPPPITGTSHVCVGGTTTLSTTSTSGSWSSSNTTVATVGTAGLVTGIAGPASCGISYTLSAGCIVTYPISVTAVPPITGLTPMCAFGDTLIIHDADPTGSYSSTVATVVNLGGGTGKLTSFAPGTSTVTYTLPSGCALTTSFTVNPLPGPITGATNICIGATTTLHNTSPSGTWTSSNPATATAGSSTGLVTGITTGTAYVTYTLPTGCKTDTIIHINPIPTFIIGYPTMVAGTTGYYTDLTPGGTWATTTPALCTITPTTGTAHALSVGLATLTYTLGTGCFITKNVAINPLTGISPEHPNKR